MSHPCTSCGTPIPDVVATAPFCPYCGARKVAGAPAIEVPGVPGLLVQPNKVVLNRGAADDDDVWDRLRRIFTLAAYETTITFDPRVGYAVLGGHRPDGEPARLRAWDIMNKRVAWEALSGTIPDDDLDGEKLHVHAGNVYVGWERNLRVLDLFTGKPKWGAELSDTIAYDSSWYARRTMLVSDAAPIGARGAIWVSAVDGVVFAFDRDTGQLLWREDRSENKPRRILPLEPGRLLLQYSEAVELVDPATRATIDRIAGRIERFDLEGQLGVVQVRHWGWRDREGILVHDFVAKKELLFEGVDDIEDDVPTVMGGGRVFCATNSGDKLFAGPNGRLGELVPGFRIKGLTLAGPTLFVLLAKHHGTSVRRILGLDPQTLAVRFDLGEMSSEPDDSYPHQMCTNGLVTVIVTSPKGDDSACELWGVDPRGLRLWSTPIGSWSAHWFLGGNVVVASVDGWKILRPDTGQIIASMP